MSTTLDIPQRVASPRPSVLEQLSAGTAPNPSLARRIDGLDELRGLSVIWVFICHGTGLTTWIPMPFAGYGFHGVVLFFMVSGYLITRILMESRDRDNYFTTFYINRLFRIWPLMLAALIACALVWPESARPIVTNLLLVNNYAYAVGIEPVMRTDVMWSLAIEEQFYLFWPVLVWLLNRTALLYVTAAIVVVGLAFDAHLLPPGHMITTKATHANMQYIAMGAMVAFGREGFRYLLGAWALFAIWWLLRHGFGALPDFRWIWYGITLALALLTYYTIEYRPLLRNQVLAFLGKLCYGIYIIHFIVSAMAFSMFGRGVWKAGLAYIAITLIISILSFHFFEMPAQKLRVHFHHSARLRVALFASLAFVVLTCVVYYVITSKF